jgi:hypothetical protein
VFGGEGGFGGSASSSPAIQLPSALGTLLFWLRNSTGLFQDAGKTTPATNNGDPVGCWADQSGNANDFTTGTAGFRPLRQAAGAITFDGVDDILTGTNATTLKPATFFCLINVTSIAGNNYMLGSVVNGALGVNANTSFLQLNTTSTALINTCSIQIAAGVPTRIIVSYDGSGNFAWYINGVSGGTGLNNVAVVSSIPSIGFAGSSLFIGGTVKDYGAYNAAISAGNAALLDAYLASL